MTLECIGSPFTYRWPEGEVRLVPGRPVDLPDHRAARLLEKAPGRVRLVRATKKSAGTLTGQIVTWDSPLFGVLSATVHEDLLNGVRVVHPLTGEPCVIPTTWLRFTPFSAFSSFFPGKS
jgi:hypothetical protein